MLKKHNRMSAVMFTNLTKGLIRHSKHFTLRYILSDDKNTTIATVVSKKVSTKAVERNRIKRRMREVVKKVIPTLEKNIIGSLSAKADTKNISNSYYIKEITELIEKTQK